MTNKKKKKKKKEKKYHDMDRSNFKVYHHHVFLCLSQSKWKSESAQHTFFNRLRSISDWYIVVFE